MQGDEIGRDVGGFQNLVALQQALDLAGPALAGEYPVDGAVHHDVRDMDALRGQLLGHGLSQRAQAGLGGGKSGEPLLAAHRGRRAGKKDRAPPPRPHHPGGFAAGEEACEGRHLPDLGEDAGRGLADAETHIGPDVEHHHLERAHLGLDAVEEGDGFLFRAGVGAERMGPSAFRDDGIGQGLGLIEVARPARDTDAHPFDGKGPGHRRAQPVTRADDQTDTWLAHAAIPVKLCERA